MPAETDGKLALIPVAPRHDCAGLLIYCDSRDNRNRPSCVHNVLVESSCGVDARLFTTRRGGRPGHYLQEVLVENSIDLLRFGEQSKWRPISIKQCTSRIFVRRMRVYLPLAAKAGRTPFYPYEYNPVRTLRAPPPPRAPTTGQQSSHSPPPSEPKHSLHTRILCGTMLWWNQPLSSIRAHCHLACQAAAH